MLLLFHPLPSESWWCNVPSRFMTKICHWINFYVKYGLLLKIKNLEFVSLRKPVLALLFEVFVNIIICLIWLFSVARLQQSKLCLINLKCLNDLHLLRLCFSYLSYYQQYAEFDPFMTQPDPSNPWISDNTDFWEVESSM